MIMHKFSVYLQNN